MTKTAVIIGVGPCEGLGAYLCVRAAKEGLHVIVSGRTQKNLELVVQRIFAAGGEATAITADATDSILVNTLIRKAEAIGPIDLAVYNAGNNFPGDFLAMESGYFEDAWRVCTLGGFLFSQAVLKEMAKRTAGTLIFTGASASMRGKPNFSAFTAAKAGLRALAQSLAREFQPKGIHIGHIVIDGGIMGDKVVTKYPEFAKVAGEDGLIGLSGIVESYMHIYRQPRNAWTHELDLRAYKETF